MTTPDFATLIAEARELVAAGEEAAALAHVAPAADHPDAPPSLLWLAGRLGIETELERAMGWLERAVELAPHAEAVRTTYIDAVSDYVEVLSRIGYNDESLATLRRAYALVGAARPIPELIAVFEMQALRPTTARALVTSTEDVPSFVRALLTVHDGDWSAARELWPALLELPDLPPAPPAPPAPPPYYLAPVPRADAGIVDIAMVTSLSPRGGPRQRQAITTWAEFGARLISVNTRQEIAELAPLFPDVEFQETARDGRETLGKPLVYIDDLLSALAETGADTCGIVNADILLLDGERLRDEIAAAGAALTIYHRLNLATPDDRDGPAYLPGFDAFFFPRDWIPQFVGSRLSLGAPWWDYLFSTIAVLRSLPIRVSRKSPIGHVIHPVNWSRQMYVATAAYWLDAANVAAKTARCPLAPAAAFIAPILNAFAAHHRLHDVARDEAALAAGGWAGPLSMLVTLVNHLVRTQARRIADPLP